MQTLIALANGDVERSNTLVVSGLQREGLVAYKTAPGDVEGITIDLPILTPRGRTVLELVEHDIVQYLSRVRGKRRRE